MGMCPSKIVGWGWCEELPDGGNESKKDSKRHTRCHWIQAINHESPEERTYALVVLQTKMAVR